MADVGSARIQVEGDVRDFARQTERDLDKELAKIKVDPVEVPIDQDGIRRSGEEAGRELSGIKVDPVEIPVDQDKARKAGKQAGRDLGDGVAEGVDSKRGGIASSLKKAFTPNPGVFDALKAPFIAALSTPIGAAVITVAGTAALAFVGAFTAALATAGLGAVFLGLGAAALLGGKKDRDKAEKDLKAAEERVRKAELRAQSGTAASKRSLAEAMAALAKAQEAVGKNEAFVKLDASLKNLGATLKRVGQEAAQPLMGPLTEAFDTLVVGVKFLGKSLEEVFFQLAPAIGPLVDGLVGFVDEFLDVLIADPVVLEGMRDSLIALGDNLPKVGKALGDLFASMAANKNNVRNIGILFDFLVGVIDNVAISIFVLGQILDGLVVAWNAIGDAGSAAIDWITGTAVPAITGAASAVGGFFGAIPGVIAGAWSAVTGFFSSIWTSITGFFSTVGTAIAGFFTALPGNIIGALTALPGMLLTYFSNLISNTAYLVGFALGSIVRFFIDLPGRIMDAVKSLGGLIAGVFVTLFNTAIAVTSSGTAAVIDFFVKFPERARNAFSSLVSVVSSVFTSAGTSARTKANDLVNGAINVIRGLPGRISSTLASVRSSVINAFAGAGSWLYNAGQNLIYGIGNGIFSALQWAVNAAWNAARRIVQGFLDALRIGSPSKVGADDIGEPLMAGVAVGLKDNVGLVDKQIQDMISNSFGVDLPAFTVPASAQARGGDGAALTQPAGGTPAFNVQVFVGDKEIKDVVRVEINEHDRALGGQVSSGTGGFRV